MMFAEAFDNERQSSWLDGITDALEYFGGSPEVLVMDNAKALIKTTDWREGIPQAEFFLFVTITTCSLGLVNRLLPSKRTV